MLCLLLNINVCFVDIRLPKSHTWPSICGSMLAKNPIPALAAIKAFLKKVSLLDTHDAIPAQSPINVISVIKGFLSGATLIVTKESIAAKDFIMPVLYLRGVLLLTNPALIDIKE